MNELVKIHDHKGQKVVSARELHYYLEVQSKFADWIKNRIEKYEFIENVDYTTFSKNLESGGKQIEYAIMLDMAKELSMVENNEKGKTARRYFIACEKRIKAIPAIPQSFAEALELAAHQAREIEAKDKLIAIQAPKAELADRLIDTETRIDIGQAAKLLKLPYGRNTFFKELRDRGIFFKNRNEPKQEYVDRGYFQLFMILIPTEHHGDLSKTKIVVPQKGLSWLAKIFGTSLNDQLPNLNAI